jgi:hypothetical protein
MLFSSRRLGEGKNTVLFSSRSLQDEKYTVFFSSRRLQDEKYTVLSPFRRLYMVRDDYFLQVAIYSFVDCTGIRLRLAGVGQVIVDTRLRLARLRTDYTAHGIVYVL